MLGIEALDLLDAGASVLGEVEDVHLAVREDDPHADCGVTQAVDAALGVGDGVVLQLRCSISRLNWRWKIRDAVARFG